ncbi:MAG TPA: TonB-dependent receptor plug domain-containing protein, partial [Sphingomonadaceae bacterium]|nr:TonB-dependent receptor plug domain-containing protein [Sphingomonadaceae bacterium]
MTTHVIGKGWHSGLMGSCAAAALVFPAAALAQDNVEMPVPEETALDRATGATVYTPEDFARFAPRNVLDMLAQVPGFTIRSGSQGRGLGQTNDNVLINGERVASKSDGIFEQLRRITPERVVRIEIVDGSTLGIPGLSGQVANVITKGGAISGQFEYRIQWRPKYAKPSYFGGNISVSGSSDDFEWSLAYNHGNGRGAAAGPGYITDGLGNITEHRDIYLHFEGEFPSLSGRVKWTSPGGTIVNANANYGRRYTDFSN